MQLNTHMPSAFLRFYKISKDPPCQCRNNHSQYCSRQLISYQPLKSQSKFQNQSLLTWRSWIATTRGLVNEIIELHETTLIITLQDAGKRVRVAKHTKILLQQLLHLVLPILFSTQVLPFIRVMCRCPITSLHTGLSFHSLLTILEDVWHEVIKLEKVALSPALSQNVTALLWLDTLLHVS